MYRIHQSLTRNNSTNNAKRVKDLKSKMQTYTRKAFDSMAVIIFRTAFRMMCDTSAVHKGTAIRIFHISWRAPPLPQKKRSYVWNWLHRLIRLEQRKRCQRKSLKWWSIFARPTELMITSPKLMLLYRNSLNQRICPQFRMEKRLWLYQENAEKSRINLFCTKSSLKCFSTPFVAICDPTLVPVQWHS